MQVGKKELSQNREGSRGSTQQIYLAAAGILDNGAIWDINFNFSADFTQVWIDNTVKPSPTYAVKYPNKVKAFFTTQLGSQARIKEVSSAA